MLVCVVAALAGGWLAGRAVADGDPASDVLATQALFLSADAGIGPTQQAQLGAILQSAQHAAEPIRVAIVASPIDLGSVTELWRHPQDYAKFLGQELGLVYRGTLLVVMPDGFGVYRASPRAGDTASAVTGLSAPGRRLGTATLAAIERLAAAAGHPLAIPQVRTRARGATTDITAWIVLAIGGLAIAAAWTASLRARPVGRRAVAP